MEKIDDILNEQPQPEEAVLTDPPSEIVDTPTDRFRDEKGRFAKKEETGEAPAPVAAAPIESAPPAEPVNQLPREEFTALKDERRKRQELERRLQMMEQQLTNPPRPQQPPVDFWDDPHGYMSQQFNSFGEQLLQQWERRQQVERLNASEAAAKGRYADYDEAYEAFADAVHANPRLAHEMAQASDPAEYAYRKGKLAIQIQNTGSIDDLRAQVRAEIEAEARAVIAPAKPQLPSTTAADGSVGVRSGPEWTGPTPLKQILG